MIDGGGTIFFHELQPEGQELVAESDKGLLFWLVLMKVSTKTHGTKLVKDYNDWEKFCLHFMVILLDFNQITWPIHNRFIVLDNDDFH